MFHLLYTVEPLKMDSPYYGNLHNVDKSQRSRIIPCTIIYVHKETSLCTYIIVQGIQERAHPRKCDGVQLPNLVHKYVLVEIFVRHDALLYPLTDALSFPHTTL